MIKNLNTFKLLGILLVLILIYFAFNYYGDKSRSKSFHEELVTVDTAKVDKIVISKGEDQLELKKEAEDWKVKLKDDRYVKATDQSVKGTLESLMTIKPSRIVARDKAKWKDYQVDSAGTQVKVFEGDENTLDLIIGRFGFKDQRNFHTFVRLADEEDVYVANNFMAMSLNTDPSGYRNSQVGRIKKDSLVSVEFVYPDSAFTLVKDNGAWNISGTPTDSAATAEFLNGLNNMNSSSFYDDALPSNSPELKVIFKRKSEEDIVMQSWIPDDSAKIIMSSENDESIFVDDSLFDKVFKTKSDFLNPQE